MCNFVCLSLSVVKASQHHFTSAVKKNFSDSRHITVESSQSGLRHLRTILLLILAPFPPANACQKIHGNSSQNGLASPQSAAASSFKRQSSPPHCESARFVVGDPQLASHRFTISPQLSNPVDIALPYMPSKKLDLLYCLVSRHLATCGMRLQLRQGSSTSSGVKEIVCWDCGGQFPFYELHVSWGTHNTPTQPTVSV